MPQLEAQGILSYFDLRESHRMSVSSRSHSTTLLAFLLLTEGLLGEHGPLAEGLTGLAENVGEVGGAEV